MWAGSHYSLGLVDQAGWLPEMLMSRVSSLSLSLSLSLPFPITHYMIPPYCLYVRDRSFCRCCCCCCCFGLSGAGCCVFRRCSWCCGRLEGNLVLGQQREIQLYYACLLNTLRVSWFLNHFRALLLSVSVFLALANGLDARPPQPATRQTALLLHSEL